MTTSTIIQSTIPALSGNGVSSLAFCFSPFSLLCVVHYMPKAIFAFASGHHSTPFKSTSFHLRAGSFGRDPDLC